MRMQFFAAAVLLIAGAGQASAQAAPIQFDQGVSISHIIKTLKADLKELPAVPGEAAKTAAPEKKAKAAKRVRLSGWLRLSGNDYVGESGGFAHVWLDGSVRLQGDGYYTDTIFVREWVSVYVSRGSSHVSEHVRVWERADVHDRSGKYVGNAMADANVWVSGWVNGGWLRLSGSDYIDLDITVEE